MARVLRSPHQLRRSSPSRIVRANVRVPLAQFGLRRHTSYRHAQLRISPFLVIASIPRGSPGAATALATAEDSSSASRNDSRRDSLVSSGASSRDRQDLLITQDDTLPLKGEVSRKENNASSRLTLLTGTKSRIFSYTGCRGHPCPGKRETHGGFHIQSRSSPRSRVEVLLSDEGCSARMTRRQS